MVNEQKKYFIFSGSSGDSRIWAMKQNGENKLYCLGNLFLREADSYWTGTANDDEKAENSGIDILTLD